MLCCCYVLYNMCHVMLYHIGHEYNIRYVMLYNICNAMLYNINMLFYITLIML